MLEQHSNTTPKTVFVTGATGLVGFHLIKALLKNNFTVKALYHSTKPAQFLHENVEWIEGDILDISLLCEILPEVQQVYHCAGLVSFHPSQKQQLYHVNVEGTANMVNASLEAGVEKFLFVSSVAALDKGKTNENGFITEEQFWEPPRFSNAYAQSKYLAEMEVWRGVGEGLKAVIVNPAIILGNANWSKGSTELFQSVYKEFPWYTEGVNGFVDVQDVVRAIILLMNSNVEAERFILCAENISYKDLFTQIALAFQKQPPHKKVTPFLAELIWRIESLKYIITKKAPMITKDTARTALQTVRFDNSKLLKQFPHFSYTPLQQTIERICAELLQSFQTEIKI